MSTATPDTWIGTGWKMNKTLSEGLAYAQKLKQVETSNSIQRFVIPPFTCCRQVKEALADSNILVGGQNMHWETEGAWTGEVSAPMLVDCGLDIVELGHSERRAHFGETDERVGQKVETALQHNLMPLVCIGETLDEREAGNASVVLERQVRIALGKVAKRDCAPPILMAYEPVWAIGENGIPASAEYANERQAEIAVITRELLGTALPCLYGGSVTADNCEELIACEHVDGLFIGRAAWNLDEYLEILSRSAAVISK